MITKKQLLQHLSRWVYSQGTQAGLAISPLLQAMIQTSDTIYTIEVADNADNDKAVVTPQQDIDQIVAQFNEDAQHHSLRVDIQGVVLTFGRVEYTPETVTATAVVEDGRYTLTLATAGASRLTFTPAGGSADPSTPTEALRLVRLTNAIAEEPDDDNMAEVALTADEVANIKALAKADHLAGIVVHNDDSDADVVFAIQQSDFTEPDWQIYFVAANVANNTYWRGQITGNDGNKLLVAYREYNE